MLVLINYRVFQKKWCTFENAVIRNGKQIETLFFYNLDKWLEYPKKNSAFYHFQVPMYGENMHFCQKMAEKKSLKFFEIYHFRCILPKISIPCAKSSLK